ncbi:unnamed protein product [Didymodactylos carnosus]|uniref:Uncharacterized protein n=1 Tax=Didymodactylos carnosus TaxID=1234261 RepID=A0A815UYS0_9BILA|nr:unnamed protein product [Didymodactylos carnosus]CAF1520570.1 unnamed protein product [Didymodactylos carnosus]CAF4028579.1 unnamed protein product [Didymodactylos carnosus]CAF4380033.1 unnamed protein product [Didymodactylos carnosus]
MRYSLPVTQQRLRKVCMTPMVIMCLLQWASQNKLLTYAQIDERTSTFVCGGNNTSDQLPVIKIKHMTKGHLVGNAAQKLLLFRLFSIIFADITDNNRSLT